MKIYGHRGYSGCYPENTMLSFEKAAEAKADGIELDVQLTKDGQVVVIHDERIDRTTDGTGAVRDYSLKEIGKFNASAAWGGKHPAQHIPTFEEYCEWASTLPLITNIELKTGIVYYEDLEEKTIDILDKYNLLDRVMFSSFNHSSLITTKRIAPSVPVGALVGEQGLVNAGYYCRKYGFEYYHPSHKALGDASVGEIHSHGIGLNVWTVNGMAELERLHAWSVAGVITNYPSVCRHYLEGCDK